jgi:hypothetical protein
VSGKGYGNNRYTPMPWWALLAVTLIVFAALALTHLIACGF